MMKIHYNRVIATTVATLSVIVAICMPAIGGPSHQTEAEAASNASTESNAQVHAPSAHGNTTPVEIVSQATYQEHEQQIADVHESSLESLGLAALGEFSSSNWMFWALLGAAVFGVICVVLWYRLGYLDRMPIGWKLGAGVAILLGLTLSIGFESHVFQAKLHAQEQTLEHAAKIDFLAERMGRAELAFMQHVQFDEEAAQKDITMLREARADMKHEIDAIINEHPGTLLEDAANKIEFFAADFEANFDKLAIAAEEIRMLRDSSTEHIDLLVEHVEEAVLHADQAHDQLIADKAPASEVLVISDWIALLEHIELTVLRVIQEQNNYLLDHDHHHINRMGLRLGETKAALAEAKTYLATSSLSDDLKAEGQQIVEETTEKVKELQYTANKIVVDDLTIALYVYKSEADLHTVEAIAETLLDRTKAEYKATSAKAQQVALLMLAIAIAIGVLVSITMSLSIVKPIKKMLPVVQAMSEGDMTGRLDENRTDEFGKLAKTFNGAMGKLNHLLARLAGSTEEVAAASTEMAATAEEMARGMDEQRGQVTNVSAAIEEMSATVMEVARQTAEANQTAGQAGQQATEGGNVVDQTVDSMSQIAEVVNNASDAVSTLGDRADQIGQVIDVINDIADQTNLLALNAAIEAARAGEHGRGFAVVADEVRKLAERTTQATEEVGQSIRSIQEEAAATIERMGSGAERVNTGVACAQEAGKALGLIVTDAQNVAHLIQGITSSTEQQSQASDDIARSVEQITSVTAQSAEGANQMAQAADQLSRKSDELDSLISQFRIERTDIKEEAQK